MLLKYLQQFDSLLDTGCVKFLVIFEKPVSQLLVDQFSKLVAKSNIIESNNTIKKHLGKDKPIVSKRRSTKS